MKSQLIPPPELAPPSVKHLPIEKRIQIWAALMGESRELLLASLRDRAGPTGDWQSAYRDWYARCMDDHDRMQVHFAENLTRRERGNAR